ncbi:MAG: hypothetical protein K6T75_06100 [Acetobacteraceae bacterium]|nr:hypothetical protein [Acetobacteraceae bacterium]
MRIGEKVVDRRKIERVIDRILELRQAGVSQQDVARRLRLDRTLVCRLEKVGEVRRGKRIAVVGFPLENVEELEAVCREEGVEFTLLMTDRQRWDFVQQRSGIELFNQVMEIIAKARQCDVAILIGSDRRVRFMEGLQDRDKETVGIEIGASPIKGDVYFSPERLRAIIRAAKAGEAKPWRRGRGRLRGGPAGPAAGATGPVSGGSPDRPG